MNEPKFMAEIDLRRRRFFGGAAMTIAAAQLGLMTTAAAAQQEKPMSAASVGPGASFGPLKQIDAGVLSVGYADLGPADAPAVILLHGWPYDIHTYAEAAPLVAAHGYRVIVPYLRGYGPTRFLSADAVRNGQQSAVAVDAIALMDALGIERAVVGGCDWGARSANIVAALWPERCEAMVSVSGYLIGSQKAGAMPLPPKAELQWWYQVLLRDGAWPRRLCKIHARLRAAHLAARLTAMDVRRRHLRAERSLTRQSRSRRYRRS